LTNFPYRINVTFIDKDGQKIDFQVAEGDNLLDIAQANDLEMEGSSIASNAQLRFPCH
jgi:ferredoxin